MSVTPADAPLLTGYQLRLPTFEGPLDVLLRLIERHQLSITDVSLMSVTDQFLRYLAELEAAPAETVAEFAAVGGRLVLLKSRSLLPRPPAPVEDADPDDLVQQLVAYRAIKDAASRFAIWDAGGGGAFARGDGGVALPARTAPPPLAMHAPGTLARALRRRLTALPAPHDLIEARPVVTLRQMAERVLTTLRGHPTARFSEIATGCQNRPEVLTAFLAVLVLIRRRLLDAEQPDPFGEITLRATTTNPSVAAIRAPARTTNDD